MKAENKRYYSKKGKRIYSDFLTFASADSTVAECVAKEFLSKFGKSKGAVSIAEFGVGNGNFAKRFLQFLEKNAPKLEVRYALHDMSENMLSDAKKNLGKLAEKCEFVQFDAHSGSLSGRKFDFAIMNELLCDLEAEVHSAEDKAKEAEKNGIVSAFCNRIEKERKIPFNFEACDFLSKVHDSLKNEGIIHVFDYGFYSFSDIQDIDVKIWNGSICREYGTQITCDVNFPLLMAHMGARGAKASMETQKEFVERKMGYPVKVEERKDGLFYVKAGKEKIREEDGFYHLQISRAAQGI